MTSSADDGLHLSVAPHGPVQGVLRVAKERFQYVLENAVIFTGAGGSTWVPRWTVVTEEEEDHNSRISFTDIPLDADKDGSPPPVLAQG
jgi:hypothetical protein